MKIGSIRNNRRRQPQIRTSHILIICVLGGAVLLFGSSLAFIIHQTKPTSDKNDSGSFIVNNNNYDTSAITKERHGNKEAIPKIAYTKAKEAIDKVKEEFYDRYGGQEQATQFLQKTITFFGNSIDSTADRILRAIARQEAFVMGFAGYSITVGRGNYFHQSFPFVVERVLKDAMLAVGVPSFVVRNSAIGGIPSFPYAYCLDHFVSKETDVLSWDFSMNEMSKDPAVFEAYIRQALHQLPKQPMIIMVDSNALRTQLLQNYVKSGLLQGALTVAKAESVIDAKLLALPDNEKPRGLREWDVFGAPDACPGKGSWHPKKQEHEFMGYMIAMHFVQALERVYEKQLAAPEQWYKPYQQTSVMPKVLFPDPLSSPPPNEASVTEILFGTKVNNNQYQMKELSCRTNFLPATDYEKVLQSLIVSGMAVQATAANIMETRSDDMYQKGWVLDVSEVERDTKRKVEQCGGLGYIDMKIALYGTHESGPLELFLPYEGPPHDPPHDVATLKDAQLWFDGLIICEANDKRPKQACQLDRDVEYTVGGIKVPSVVMVNGAGEYLKRKTCVNVGVPVGAQISRRKAVGVDGHESIGLSVLITAKNPVTRKDGACCLSHIVWEQH
jgi:hypothetical protein